MIQDLKPYPAYKNSDVPWLGKVPSHWEVAACRHRYSQCLGKMLDTKRIRGEHLLPYLRNVDVQWDRINTSDLPLMDITPAEYDRYTLKSGDLLVCEGGEVGRCATWRGDLAICGFQKALHRLRPISGEDVPRFLHYVLMVASQSGGFADGHESTIAHLTGDKLRAHRFSFPPLIEQSAVVRFLDHADRRIRRYIRAKRRLMALLNEQRQAIIHRAVTRGLDADVGLRHSGVEWLGDLPVHWEVRRAKQLFREVDHVSLGLSLGHFLECARRFLDLVIIAQRFHQQSVTAGFDCDHCTFPTDDDLTERNVLGAVVGHERSELLPDRSS